jgi:outer membrane protein assembly factor BamD (BamD/ComL family)
MKNVQRALAQLNKETIMAEVTDQEPVLVLNDKKYIISELEPQAQYCVGQMNYIKQQQAKAQEELDRHTMAYMGFQSQLTQMLEPDTEDSAEAE